MGEFDLIRQFFTRPTPHAVLGVGDDCALLQSAPGMQMAISTDMLVSGRHFFPDTDPLALGHKCLAVNLSDLAASGARPLAFTLALALPDANAAWLAPFAQGLLALADAHGCELIGGDTTRGPLNICITVFGEVPAQASPGRAALVPTSAMLRSGAQVGDDVYVSGNLGDAALALHALLGRVALPPDVLAQARKRLERPSPRVALGQALRGVASACADVSDGLLGDLGHILERSGLGAEVQIESVLPLLAARAHYPGGAAQFDQALGAAWDAQNPQTLALQCVLAGGDDYELVFCAAPAQREAVQAAAAQSDTPVTRIGSMQTATGLRLVDGLGRSVAPQFSSFDHFSGTKPNFA
jgi:thiamine-monophosphate kinase